MIVDTLKDILFYGMFTVHFHKIKNNNILQVHFNTFITYVKYSYMFRPSWAIFRAVKHQSNNNNNMRSELSGPCKS
jgi:hypothetical protein